MYRVHGSGISGNCYKVRLALEQLGLPYEWVHVDVVGGETRTPAFLEKNLNGKVPVLELDHGAYLPESNAILCYLAEGTPLLPDDRLERARVLQWLFFEQYSHEPYVAVARFIVKYLGAPADRAADLALRREKGHVALGVMERHLASNDFFAAGRYTVADISLYAYTHVAHEGGIDVSGYPRLVAWLARVAAQPGYVAMAPTG